MGLGRESHSCNNALQKYLHRSELWSGIPLGMHLSARVYNCFVITVFSFLWQLESPPAFVLEAEEKVLRKFTPGPGEWRVAADFLLAATFRPDTIVSEHQAFLFGCET